MSHHPRQDECVCFILLRPWSVTASRFWWFYRGKCEYISKKGSSWYKSEWEHFNKLMPQNRLCQLWSTFSWLGFSFGSGGPSLRSPAGVGTSTGTTWAACPWLVSNSHITVAVFRKRVPDPFVPARWINPVLLLPLQLSTLFGCFGSLTWKVGEEQLRQKSNI